MAAKKKSAGGGGGGKGAAQKKFNKARMAANSKAGAGPKPKGSRVGGKGKDVGKASQKGSKERRANEKASKSSAARTIASGSKGKNGDALSRDSRLPAQSGS